MTVTVTVIVTVTVACDLSWTTQLIWSTPAVISDHTATAIVAASGKTPMLMLRLADKVALHPTAAHRDWPSRLQPSYTHTSCSTYVHAHIETYMDVCVFIPSLQNRNHTNVHITYTYTCRTTNPHIYMNPDNEKKHTHIPTQSCIHAYIHIHGYWRIAVDSEHTYIPSGTRSRAHTVTNSRIYTHNYTQLKIAVDTGLRYIHSRMCILW